MFFFLDDACLFDHAEHHAFSLFELSHLYLKYLVECLQTNNLLVLTKMHLLKAFDLTQQHLLELKNSFL